MLLCFTNLSPDTEVILESDVHNSTFKFYMKLSESRREVFRVCKQRTLTFARVLCLPRPTSTEYK